MIDILLLLACFCSPASAVLLDSRDVARANCSQGWLPCGPGSACCPPGYFCNFNRGIPACETEAEPYISGFNGPRCVDPYLFDCSALVGIGGRCCPIGTVCFNDGIDRDVVCIDAYGTTTAAYPSTTRGFVPSATFVPQNDPNITFSPPSAWSNSSTAPSCISGNSVRTTSVLNSTVTCHYTGPSILIHVVTSSSGGVFSVSVDGFSTRDTIDSYSGGNVSLPLCYAVQYPPFKRPPPTLASQDNHNITLMYVGPSPNAPNETTAASNVQFDSFGIPTFNTSRSSASGATFGRHPGALISVPSLVLCCLFYIAVGLLLAWM